MNQNFTPNNSNLEKFNFLLKNQKVMINYNYKILFKAIILIIIIRNRFKSVKKMLQILNL
jgi:hypothetical protein